MQDKRRVLLDLDELGEVFLLLADVDVGVAVVVKDSEVAVDPHVDARGLQERLVVRLDLDAALGQKARDRAICKDHGVDSKPPAKDRKSTRLNSSHTVISYAVF